MAEIMIFLVGSNAIGSPGLILYGQIRFLSEDYASTLMRPGGSFLLMPLSL